MPSSLVLAPTTWSSWRVFLEHLDELGDALVRVGHVGVGPHDDLAPGLLGADAADRAGAAVAVEVHDLQMREPGCGLVQAVEGLVGGGVVEGEELVVVSAGVHGRADPRHLGGDVVLLVVAGQDDRDIRSRGGRNAHRGRGYYLGGGGGGGTAAGDGHGGGSDIQTFMVSGQVRSGAVQGVPVLGAAQRHDLPHRAAVGGELLIGRPASSTGRRPACVIPRTTCSTVAGPRGDHARGRDAAHPADDLGEELRRSVVDEDDRCVAGDRRAHAADRRDLALVGGLERQAVRGGPDPGRAAVLDAQAERGDRGRQDQGGRAAGGEGAGGHPVVAAAPEPSRPASSRPRPPAR